MVVMVEVMQVMVQVETQSGNSGAGVEVCSSTMSGGHFRNRRRYLLFRKIQGGGTVEFDEKVSHLTTSISKDPLLIAKADGPKVEGLAHPTDRIIKA